MSFIGIKVKELFLELNNDFTISLDIHNGPVLFFCQETENQILGDYSLPITIPATDYNRNLLGFIESPFVSGKVYSYKDIQVYFGGNHILTGELKINKPNNGEYEGYIKAGFSSMADLIKDKNLPDLDLGGIRCFYSFIEIQLSGVGTTGDVTISIDGISKTTPFNTSINQTLTDLALLFTGDTAVDFVAGVSSDVIKFTSAEDISIRPTRRKPPVWNQDLSSAGTDRVLSKVISNHSTNLQEGMSSSVDNFADNSDYCLPVIYSENFYGDKPTYLNHVNYYHDYAYRVFNASQPAATPGEYNVSPQPYVKYVLKQAFESDERKITGDFVTDEEMNQLLIYNNYAIDLEDPLGGDPQTNKMRNWFDLRDHVPNISIADFLKDFSKHFCTGYFFNLRKKEVKVMYMKNILKSAEQDFTAKATPVSQQESPAFSGIALIRQNDSSDEQYTSTIKTPDVKNIKGSVPTFDDLPSEGVRPGDVYLVTEEGVYSEYKINRNFYDLPQGYYEVLSEPFDIYTAGDRSREINIGASTTKMYGSADPITARNWLVPHVKLAGSSDYFGAGINGFSLRFLFYRGRQAASDGSIYPYATYYNTNFAQTQFWKYSLLMHGTTGIYNVFWKEWVRFLLNTRKSEFEIRFTREDIHNLSDIFQKRIRINNVNYLIAKVRLQVTQKGILPAKVEVYQVQ